MTYSWNHHPRVWYCAPENERQFLFVKDSLSSYWTGPLFLQPRIWHLLSICTKTNYNLMKPTEGFRSRHRTSHCPLTLSDCSPVYHMQVLIIILAVLITTLKITMSNVTACTNQKKQLPDSDCYLTII